MSGNMKGPFYVRDKDFQDQQVYKPADCCAECGFFDENDGGWCPMNPCIYFENYETEKTEEDK